MAEAPKQLVDALKRAVAAVEEAKVPKDLREIAFKAALGMKLQGDDGLAVQQPKPPPKHEQSKDGDEGGGPAVGVDDQFSKIAKKLKCDVNAVKHVYDIDEDGVHLLVSRPSLDSSPATAQQEVALLMLAARQGAGFGDWTGAKIVRNAAHDLGAYESNHSTYVGELQGPRMRIRGKGQSRELKLNQPGFEEAAAIVTRLAESI